MQFKGIKDYLRSFITPIPTQKKLHLVLNISWLALAVASVILGIILGSKTTMFEGYFSGNRILSVWYISSLMCIIPFLSVFNHQIKKLNLRI